MSRMRSAVGTGLVLAGVIFLLDALAIIDLWAPAGGWWPLLLMAVGLVLVMRRSTEREPCEGGRVTAVLTARVVASRDRPYQGGTATAVLGYAGLDLRKATLDRAGAEVVVRSVLGDVVVTVPPGWQVQLTATRALGDVDEDVLPAPDDAPVLRVRGVVALADLHVRTASVVA